MQNLKILTALLKSELTSGVMGLKLFIACVTIATFVVGAIWMVGDGLSGALKRGGTVFLGGDAAITVVNTPLPDALVTEISAGSDLSKVAELRTSALVGDKRIAVEVKGVDGAYPLYGSVALQSGRPLAQAFERRGGPPAIVVEPGLLQQTGGAVGDVVRINDSDFIVADVLMLEPDRLSAGRFMVGPRILMPLDALRVSGLIRPGSLVDYRYRLRVAGEKLPVLERLKNLRPETGWELETLADAGDRVIRTVERTTTFLGMAGIVALAIGLAGMWTSARAWLARRGRTIALYRLSGAQPAMTFALHASIAAIASLIGLAIGLGFASVLAVELVATISAELHLVWVAADLTAPLMEVIVLLLVGITGTTVLALSAAIDVAPGAAMRGGEAEAVLVRPQAGLGIFLIVAAMVIVTITLPIPGIAAMTEAGLAGAIAILVACSAALAGLARRFSPSGFLGTIIQQGLARVGPVATRAVAIGVGITGITAIVAAQGSLETALRSELPEKIPDLVMIDVQPDQVEAIRRLVAETPRIGGLQANPLMRMTITRVNGVPAEQALKNPDKRWVIEGDRSFSWTAEPTGAELLAGSWWRPDYDGPPVISPEEDLQEAFDLKIGDTMTFSLLGRSFTSEIVNIRKEYHRTFRPEFLLMASPNPFRGAPQSWIMSLQGETDQAVDSFIRTVSAAHPNVTSIDIRRIVAQVVEVIQGAIGASLLIAAILVLAGALTLAAVIASEVDARRREALVFTVIGASGTEIALARLGEALCVGLIASVVGGLAGWVGGYWLVTGGLRVAWAPGSLVYLLPFALGLFSSLVAGLAGGKSALPRGRGQMVRILTN